MGSRFPQEFCHWRGPGNSFRRINQWSLVPASANVICGHFFLDLSTTGTFLARHHVALGYLTANNACYMAILTCRLLGTDSGGNRLVNVLIQRIILTEEFHDRSAKGLYHYIFYFAEAWLICSVLLCPEVDSGLVRPVRSTVPEI